MFGVTGIRTTTIQALARLTGEQPVRIAAALDAPAGTVVLPEGCTRFVLAAGILYPQHVGELDHGQVVRSLSVNLASVLRIVETILEQVPRARVCIVGSESAELGSFDRLYAAAKAGVHAYVRTRIPGKGQQLVAVAPPIIADSGMTTAREDYPAVLERRYNVRALDVAEAIHALLWSKPKGAPNNRVFPVLAC